MTIEFGRWRIEPYANNGARCWQVYRVSANGKRGSVAVCYPDTLGAALRFCMEYSLRNDVEGVGGIPEALAAYERMCREVREAAERLEPERTV